MGFGGVGCESKKKVAPRILKLSAHANFSRPLSEPTINATADREPVEPHVISH
jgi:hypothetical protein